MSYEHAFVGLFFCVVAGLPIIFVWGWLRWWKRTGKQGLFSILSLIGFALATASALLAIVTAAYAKTIGGFPYYDPTLMSIYRYGALTSLAGIGFSSSGVWKPGAVRWHALVCAVGTLLYWLLLASTE
jgi:hypothetical protein